MSHKFITILEDIGKDLLHGIERVLPFARLAGALIGAVDPALGAAVVTTTQVVAATEQKFNVVASQGNTVSGDAKLAEAAQIAGPVISQALSAAGKPSDAKAVNETINAAVAFLNGLPKGTTL